MIEKLQKLARLEFTVEEKNALEADLQNILKMVEKINELSTDGVEPLTHMSDHINNVREDSVNHPISTEEALSNAPKKHGQWFAVSKVIE